jgi:integrase
VETLSRQVVAFGLAPDQLLFSSTGRADGGPISRNTFRTRVWLPALERADLGFHVRVRDLRHAHASWALAGGADLKAVMDRMGHSQISTTQRYLHSLPDSDDKALAAFSRVRDRMA